MNHPRTHIECDDHGNLNGTRPANWPDAHGDLHPFMKYIHTDNGQRLG